MFNRQVITKYRCFGIKKMTDSIVIVILHNRYFRHVYINIRDSGCLFPVGLEAISFFNDTDEDLF